MDKTPEGAARDIPFAAIESGMMVGLWHTPLDGFEWRDDLRPAIVDHGIQTEDPPDTSWWLVARGLQARRYPVLGRTRLTADFAQLGLDPTRPAILRFANRYGNLGDSTMLTPRGQAWSHPVLFKLDGGNTEWGEPLGLWQTEALTFRNLWETWQLAEFAEEVATGRRGTQARRELASRFGWNEDGSIWHRYSVGGGGGRVSGGGLITHPRGPDHKEVARNLPKGNLVAVARYWVIKQVNDDLRGRVNPTILPFRGREVRFVPENLRAAIYLRFALEISEGIGKVRECRGCSQPFTPTRKDQVFCGKNCRERASYRRRTGGPSSERDLPG